MNKLKIINDPIYGFINIPDPLIYDLIQHSYFQRLRRISQMGLSYMVYPGAMHTRFHHAIGAMHLMQTALNVLRFKEIEITPEEEQAALIAILLHDIGHGPFSHALEYGILKDISHEDISLALMKELNKEFEGKLELAIDIFKGNYPKKFLTELISSQLDVDRLDYLRRDSFYSGVIEGQVNSERLIKMMNVKDNRLVIDEKGIYSIEKFIISRRLMYWQVYFHKTGLMFEKILEKALQRAKELINKGIEVPMDKNLHFLFTNKIQELDKEHLDIYTALDDSDITYHLKKWSKHSDFILSYLSEMIIERKHLNTLEISKEKIDKTYYNNIKSAVLKQFPIKKKDVSYLVFKDKIKHIAYENKQKPILLLQKNGDLIEFSKATDKMNISALSHPVKKYYISYPKLKNY